MHIFQFPRISISLYSPSPGSKMYKNFKSVVETVDQVDLHIQMIPTVRLQSASPVFMKLP